MPTEDEIDDTEDTGGKGDSRTDRRLATITRKRKEAEEALRAAEERIDALESEVSEFKRQAKTWESVQAERDALVAERDGWAEERAMISAGLTDEEGIDLARLAYGRIKPEDRPKGGIAEWLGERDKLPRGVVAYLPAPEGEKDKGTKTTATTTQRRAPDTDTKAKHAPGAPATFQSGSVSAMSTDDLASSREAIWASLGRKPPAVNIPGLRPAEKK